MPSSQAKRTGHSASERIREFFRKKSDTDRSVQVSDLLKHENQNILKDIIEKVLESQKASAAYGEPGLLPLYNSASTQTEQPIYDGDITAKSETTTNYNSSSTQTSEDVEKAITVADHAVQVSLPLETTEAIPKYHSADQGNTELVNENMSSEYKSTGTTSQMLNETQSSTRDNNTCTKEECAPEHYNHTTPKPENKVIRKQDCVKVPWKEKYYITVRLPSSTEALQPLPIRVKEGRKILRPCLRKPVASPNSDESGEYELSKSDSWKQTPSFQPNMYNGATSHFQPRQRVNDECLQASDQSSHHFGNHELRYEFKFGGANLGKGSD
ncbi:hypothetical protein PT974_12581 [Cladobotryum mycophilum]|uniref:Uncharacterized protein n=1 Tax=Cladobotryum mycophilum TaxID=491253 RepID=A0ABR0S9B4_9HYPO